jgi:large subunit ribosomal protein L1
MANISKRLRALKEKIDRNRNYPVADALQLVKESATAKFDESVDVAVNLGVDARKSDQMVRGAVVLPKGIGKTVRVAVFAQGEIKAGKMDFDVVIATPDAMRVVGQLGQILGPRGLMPNPKVGTVSPDVVGAVKNAKAGQVQYRTDKGGIVHCTIGRASFSVDDLKENLAALLDALQRAKPASSKGIYFKRLSVSSTMGVGVRVDQASVSA